jgi:hypothetical protein
MLCAGQPAIAESKLSWADGVGMRPCSELDAVADDQLIPWVRGYWTGANLYLGGSDVCTERAHIAGIATADVRSLVRVHCADIQESPIMFAAFNALKGLPTVAGSRSAGCAAR